MIANKLRSLPVALLLIMLGTNGALGADQKAPPDASDEGAATLSGGMEAIEYFPRYGHRSPPGLKEIPNQTISTLGLEEYKPSLAIELQASQARLFRIKDRILRTAISDSKIAEPIVVTDSEFEILAKKPGVVILGLWDDAEHVSVLQLRVKNASSAPQPVISNQSKKDAPTASTAADNIPAAPIPPIDCATIALEECKKSKTIELKVSESQLFKLKNSIVRTALSDSDIAKVVVTAENGVYLIGKAPGAASLFIWDDKDAMVGIDLRVKGGSKTAVSGVSKTGISTSSVSKRGAPQARSKKSGESSSSSTSNEVDNWTAAKKDTQKVPPRLPPTGI